MSTKSDNSENPLVVVYDDACAFCRRAVAAIRARDRRRQFRYVSGSTPGLAEQYSGLALESFDTGMRIVEPDGKVHIGSDAIYMIGTKLPYFRWFAWMYRLPLIKVVTRRVYSWVAAHRLRLSRYCDAECKLDASGQTPSATESIFHMPGDQMLISLLILLIVGLHGWANVAKAIVPSSLMGDRSWPFLAYGMYRKSHSPGVIRATKQEIFALTASGQESRLMREMVGLNRQALGQHYIGPMRGGNRLASRLLADRINLAREDPIIAFRVQSDTYAISDNGVILERSQSMTYPIDK